MAAAVRATTAEKRQEKVSTEEKAPSLLLLLAFALPPLVVAILVDVTELVFSKCELSRRP